jgi:hypothetical protein
MAHRKRKTISSKDVKKALRLIKNPLLDDTESDLIDDVKPIKRSHSKKRHPKGEGAEKKKPEEKAAPPKEKEKKKETPKKPAEESPAKPKQNTTTPLEKTAAFKAAVAEALSGEDVVDPVEDQ